MFRPFIHSYTNLSFSAKPLLFLSFIQLFGISLDLTLSLDFIQHYVARYSVLIEFFFKLIGIICSIIILLKSKKAKDA